MLVGHDLLLSPHQLLLVPNHLLLSGHDRLLSPMWPGDDLLGHNLLLLLLWLRQCRHVPLLLVGENGLPLYVPLLYDMLVAARVRLLPGRHLGLGEGEVARGVAVPDWEGG